MKTQHSLTMKCDSCGEFIAPESFVTGKAARYLITEYSDEDYETLCSECNAFDREASLLDEVGVASYDSGEFYK